MRALKLIEMMDAEVVPKETKIHLAVYNGEEDPLDMYRAGKFQWWQSWQHKQNFRRLFVVSLIKMPEEHKWLFAGAYSSHGCKPQGGRYKYRLTERPACQELDGRLVAHFERPGRQSYLKAESWADRISVAEIRSERLSIPEFPGFKGLHVSKSILDLIVRENHAAWRSALSSVAGVYLITDSETGKFYVGSATGQGGIWQRWCDYAKSGHGGNRELKVLLNGASPVKRAEGLQFSVLEIADTHASVEEVRERESHWKSVLLTRIHGLNAN